MHGFVLHLFELSVIHGHGFLGCPVIGGAISGVGGDAIDIRSIRSGLFSLSSPHLLRRFGLLQWLLHHPFRFRPIALSTLEVEPIRPAALSETHLPRREKLLGCRLRLSFGLSLLFRTGRGSRRNSPVFFCGNLRSGSSVRWIDKSRGEGGFLSRLIGWESLYRRSLEIVMQVVALAVVVVAALPSTLLTFADANALALASAICIGSFAVGVGFKAPPLILDFEVNRPPPCMLSVLFMIGLNVTLFSIAAISGWSTPSSSSPSCFGGAGACLSDTPFKSSLARTPWLASPPGTPPPLCMR
mmetsp:Transcript_49416/g.139976  ORF Transcript_49416/g.139976 Transcript_49416/m.139976 type:complete len:300 (-) Transcript_49416:265-1164(-)